MVATLDFDINKEAIDPLNLKVAGPLGDNSILFDGMYYNWTGSYYGTSWSGNITYTHNFGNIFDVYDYINLAGPTSYTINNQSRIVTGGIFGAGTSTPYWIFTNISISDYAPIAVDGDGDANFQVTAIQEITYKGNKYECFALNYSTSWALYEVNTGLLMASYFVFGGSLYYTMNLDATNIDFSCLKIVSPINKTYYYSEIPIIVDSASPLDAIWCRNSTNGGTDWSDNYTLNYVGGHYVNTTDLWWEDGLHLLEIYARSSTGSIIQSSKYFTVDTYGPWIEFINPLNITYSGTNTTLRMDIVVQNFTYADSVWFRDNTGGGWSENQMLVWNSTFFITNLRFMSGEHHLQIFGNNSLNEIAQRDLWFTYDEFIEPWNYTMTEGYAYTWEDATTGIRCNMDGLDDQAENFLLPFTFDYYNESYNSMYVCTNGFVSFSYNTEWNNAPFPSSIYPYMIAPFWTDLITANPCNIFVQNLTSPNRTIIEWQNIFTSLGDLVGSFEIIIFESGDIVFNYNFLTFVPGYTCGLNFGLDTRFFNRFDELNNSIDDFSLLFSYPPNEFLPNLTDPLVSPSSGDQATLFVFNATYNDQDNNSPAYVKVIINGTSFNLEKEDIGDSNYVDGCNYTYCTYLQPGIYEYYFACSDGNNRFETLVFPGLSVTKTNLSPPLLTNAQFLPSTGYAGITSFQFTVIYSDPDNNIPSLMHLVLNGGNNLTMNKQNISDYNYMDGCIYTLNVTLTQGGYVYNCFCSDGDNVNWTVISPGPTVIKLNSAPRLILGSVTPSRGDNSTTYQFNVNYIDNENDSPVGGVLVYIDGTAFSMKELDLSDTNYTDGKKYIYTTGLGNGNHQFYFAASDGAILTTTEEVIGPSVYDIGEEPVSTDYLLEFFIALLIIAGVLLTLETLVLLRKRRKLMNRNEDLK